jgi:F0F1-type ATP synthase delta subunit
LEQKNIMHIRVSSACQLTPEQKTVIQEFMAQATKKQIIDDYEVDADLINGIRIQSNTLLWEQSVAQRLRDVKQFLLARHSL